MRLIIVVMMGLKNINSEISLGGYTVRLVRNLWRVAVRLQEKHETLSQLPPHPFLQLCQGSRNAFPIVCGYIFWVKAA